MPRTYYAELIGSNRGQKDCTAETDEQAISEFKTRYGDSLFLVFYWPAEASEDPKIIYETERNLV